MKCGMLTMDHSLSPLLANEEPVDEAINLGVLERSRSKARSECLEFSLGTSNLGSVLSDKLNNHSVSGVHSGREWRVDLGGDMSLGNLAQLGRLDEVSDQRLAVDQGIERGR